MTYDIVKRIEFGRGEIRKYPFHNMEIGDAFEVQRADRNKVAASASYHGKRYGKKFSVLKVLGSIYCVRVE